MQGADQQHQEQFGVTIMLRNMSIWQLGPNQARDVTFQEIMNCCERNQTFIHVNFWLTVVQSWQVLHLHVPYHQNISQLVFLRRVCLTLWLSRRFTLEKIWNVCHSTSHTLHLQTPARVIRHKGMLIFIQFLPLEHKTSFSSGLFPSCNIIEYIFYIFNR